LVDLNTLVEALGIGHWALGNAPDPQRECDFLNVKKSLADFTQPMTINSI